MLSPASAPHNEKRPKAGGTRPAPVKIGDKFWFFRSIHGRQFVKLGDSEPVEYAVVRDDATHTVNISDSMPLDVQLAQAARAALLILADHERAGKAVLP